MKFNRYNVMMMTPFTHSFVRAVINKAIDRKEPLSDTAVEIDAGEALLFWLADFTLPQHVLEAKHFQPILDVFGKPLIDAGNRIFECIEQVTADDKMAPLPVVLFAVMGLDAPYVVMSGQNKFLNLEDLTEHEQLPLFRPLLTHTIDLAQLMIRYYKNYRIFRGELKETESGDE